MPNACPLAGRKINHFGLHPTKQHGLLCSDCYIAYLLDENLRLRLCVKKLKRERDKKI